MKALKNLIIIVSVAAILSMVVLCALIEVNGLTFTLQIIGVIAIFAGVFYAAVIACVLIDIAKKGR